MSISICSGVMVIIGSFLLSTFAAAVDWLNGYEFLSLLHYFPAIKIVENGIMLSDSSVLAVISLLTLLISWVLFLRRDIN